MHLFQPRELVVISNYLLAIGFGDRNVCCGFIWSLFVFWVFCPRGSLGGHYGTRSAPVWYSGTAGLLSHMGLFISRPPPEPGWSCFRLQRSLIPVRAFQFPSAAIHRTKPWKPNRQNVSTWFYQSSINLDVKVKRFILRSLLQTYSRKITLTPTPISTSTPRLLQY